MDEVYNWLLNVFVRFKESLCINDINLSVNSFCVSLAYTLSIEIYPTVLDS